MKNIRVVVVDDSAFSRRTITKMLDRIEGVEVVGYAINGEEGIQKVIALKPDLVTLDLQMPKMDGFTLLRILTARFSVPVIVISALSGAEEVFKALELGAFDFIAKPSSSASTDLLTIRGDLQQKVLQVLNLKPGRLRQHQVPLPEGEQPEQRQDFHPARSVENKRPVSVVAIGASTGGPPALQGIFSSFEKHYPFAVVVSQHMPAGFTRAFAERLNRNCAFTVKEAEDGDPVLPGHVLIAPGGKNLLFEHRGGEVTARVVSPTPADRFIPSVDVMFESCASIFRDRLVAVVLTGMGNDGSKGILSVKQQGGYVISESEESAVVFGMPREAIATGVVDRVAPLRHVAREILAKCVVE